MANFDIAIVKTLAKEGGDKITDDPSDRGGVTKYGISSRSYQNIDIRNLTEQQARDIYKRDYWDKVLGDEILSQMVAESLFDTAVNMGVKTATRLAQTATGQSLPDGILGQSTLKWFNNFDEKSFIALFTLAKIYRHTEICNRDPSQKKYHFGWIRRDLGMI
jgi:lysozyme family protein